MGWRITEWERFEPTKRTDRDHSGPLAWWQCPASQNRRYKQLIADRCGWEMLGVWHAVVASWGRQSEASRDGGVLRTSLAGDRPATLEELAVDIICPAKKLERAIRKFLSLGWLSEVATRLATTDIPAVVNPSPRLEKSRIEKSREDKEKSAPLLNFGGDVENPGVVMLTQAQWHKLGDKLGEATRNELIEDANNYFHKIGPKAVAKDYKSHYHTILSWKRRADREGRGTGRVASPPGKYDGVAQKGAPS